MSPRGLVIAGAGRVGGRVARLAAERGWPLAGAFNRPGPKVGQDLGVLAGADAPLGVVVSDDLDDLLAGAQADIAVVAISDSIEANFPVYRRLMEAGLNVVSAGVEASYPAAVSPALAEEIDAIGKHNGVTFTGSGFQDTYRIGIAKLLCGACTRLDAVEHRSAVDVGLHGAAAARVARVGMTPDDFSNSARKQAASGPSIYRVFLEHVTAAIGFRARRVEERLEPVLLDRPVACAALGRTIEPGMSAGSRFSIEIDTEEGPQIRANSALSLLLEGERELLEWRVQGDSPAVATLTDLDTGLGTATHLVNRIPQVLAAAPGLITLDRLGPLSFTP